MMDLKLAWRAWKTGYRDQFFVKNVTIDNLALSNQQGERDLFVLGDSHSPGASLESSIADKTDGQKETVQVTTLDAYAAANLKAPGLGELPAAVFRDELHQKQDGDRFRDAKDYYNNFIFIPVAEPL